MSLHFAPPWVVVGLTDGDCEGKGGEDRDCVSWVHGPFDTQEQAREYAARIPEGFRPHLMTVEEPM
jgi:hypothetical protein